MKMIEGMRELLSVTRMTFWRPKARPTAPHASLLAQLLWAARPRRWAQGLGCLWVAGAAWRCRLGCRRWSLGSPLPPLGGPVRQHLYDLRRADGGGAREGLEFHHRRARPRR